ncbi:ABC transporter permease [Rhizobium sp. BK251]|uniref:ABC transporter permease n=1 Tax=Rhizobium sp. BK251 TaxID=2512125 RepID=UPI0010D2A740|nr:ABC transporter permease [Rhizobium sp. BK251]TCL69445.1 spermidine/putrescine transport system permease protein [Rhizobium sp. BK251]
MTMTLEGAAKASRSDTVLATVLAALPRFIFAIYMALFFIYMFLPLAVMAIATFNASKFPTVTPWLGTTLDWFAALWADQAMWKALRLSIFIGLGVIAISLPIGTAAALFLNSLQDRSRSFFYALMVSPLLTPGVAIGIATLVLWRQAGVGGGTLLIVLAQSSFITAYVMLMIAARLQRFDRTLEDAAIGLGASRFMVFRRILLPYLKPSLLAATFIAFLQSFENYNTTLFVRGTETPLTIYIATKVRTGLTPAVNALGLVLIVLTIIAAVAFELSRRSRR